MTSNTPSPWLGTGVLLGEYWTVCSFWHRWASTIYGSKWTSSFLDSFIQVPWEIVTLLRACLLVWSMSPHSRGKKRFTFWVMILATMSQRFKASLSQTHCGEGKTCRKSELDCEGIFSMPISPKPPNHILLVRKTRFSVLFCLYFQNQLPISKWCKDKHQLKLIGLIFSVEKKRFFPITPFTKSIYFRKCLILSSFSVSEMCIIFLETK